MTNKTKYIGGPKSAETKAISSRNSITHGLTARQWTNNNEQELFNITVDAFIDDFDPQSYIEKALIAKMAECIVRLMRIQKTENAMFDLASSESEHINEIVKSLDNGNIDPKLVKTLRAAYLNNLLLDANTINNKTYIINEITSLNLSAISNWSYVEQHMPMTKNYIIDKCTEKNLNICEYINKNDNPHNLTVRFISAGDPLYNDEPLSNKEITKDIDKIKSAALQQYLKQLTVALDSELNVQIMVKNLETRSQQVKDAAIPDPQMLTLIQRYRTSNERQFSKSLAELIALQDRQKNLTSLFN
jgi:hypothetical protein